MLNLVVLEGRLTREVEVKKVNEKSACSFSIAVTNWMKDKDGNNTASFIECSAWGKQAEAMANIHKGDLFSVSGRLQTRSYIDKNKVTRTITEVVVAEVNYLTPKQKSETRKDDELPF